MATTAFVNRARMTTDTTGTGSSVNLVVAVPKYFTFSEAGLQDGDVVDYIIEDGDDFEIQHDQTYSSSGPSLSRGTPAASKVGGSAGTSQITLSGGAQVAIVGLAKSFDVSSFTAKPSPATDDVLWGHSGADGERRGIPVSGILGLVPTPGVVLLDSGTVSSASALDLVLTNYSAYRAFKILISALRPATDNVVLHARVSTDGGSTFVSTSSTYRSTLFQSYDNGSNVNAGVGDAMTLAISTSNNSVGGISGDIEVHNAFSSTVATHLVTRLSNYAADANVLNIIGVGRRQSAEVNDAIRLYMSSGNIASGSWALYGYA